MPNIIINRQYLLSLIGNKLKNDELEKIIYELGFEVERSEENELTVEITSNRPDLFSAVGIARAIRNFMHINKNYSYHILKKNTEMELTVTVDKSVEKTGLFISGFIVKNIKLDEVSLADIFYFSEKLSDTLGRMRKKMAIGMHNLDNMKKDIAFTMTKDEEFIPLKGSSKQLYSDIIKNTEKGKLYGKTIPQNKIYPILKDEEGTVALVPIINSDRTAVTKNTRNLFIEVTGTSMPLVNKINEILATTFVDMGGELFAITIKTSKKTIQSPVFDTPYIHIQLSKLESEIGVEIGFNNIISLANKMGYEAALIGKKIRFTIPPYRSDILNDQDIIEDICIAYGYDYIPMIPVASIHPGTLAGSNVLFEALSNAMVGAGFTESMSTYLTNEDKNFLKMNQELPEKTSYVTLKDAKSSNLSMARTWLLPSLLNTISLSKHDKLPQKVFELDIVFIMNDKTPTERYHLAGVSTNSRSNFNYIKSIVESILSVSDISFSIIKNSNKSFIDGRCAAIIIDGVERGVFGEIHPKVLNNFEVEEPTVAFELEL